jgi:hypothetical protein
MAAFQSSKPLRVPSRVPGILESQFHAYALLSRVAATKPCPGRVAGVRVSGERKAQHSTQSHHSKLLRESRSKKDLE